MEKLTIANWSEDDQPREKLRDKGPQALSNAELLAILIGSGTPGTVQQGVGGTESMAQMMMDCILIGEVETKDIMTKSSLPVGGYSVNPYVGCTHACRYCYAS